MLIGILVFMLGAGIMAAIIDYYQFEDMMFEYDMEYRKRILNEWKN